MNRNATLVKRSSGDPLSVYRSLLLSVAGLITLWVYLHGLSWLAVVMMPLLAIGLVLGRLCIFALAIPALLFYMTYDSPPVFENGQLAAGTWSMGIAALLLISATARLQMFTHAVFPADAVLFRVAPSKFKADDVGTRRPRDISSFRLSEMSSLVVIPLAWTLGTVLVDRIYDQLQHAQEFGLLPQGFVAVQLALALLVLFLVCQCFMGYARWLLDGKALAAMRLRHEAWKWNGPEQRLVARQQSRTDPPRSR